MPVVVCPKCRAELDLDAEDIGHRVECPGCLATFVATRPAEKKQPPPTTEEPPAANDGENPPSADTTPPTEPPPLPPTPTPSPEPAAPPPPERTSDRSSRRSDDPITLTCPACQGSVSVTPDDLGHKVECPMCQQVFRAEDPDRRSSRGGKDSRRSSRRDDDDEPGWRRSSRRSRSHDDDDDDRPRRSRRGPEDPYESPDPKVWVWQTKRDLATPGGGLEVLGWLDVAFGLLSILIGVLAGIMEPTSITGGPSWMMFWLNLGPGISGVVLGAVKAIGGRNMKQAKNRPLATAACVAACVPLNVSCCISALAFPAYIVGIVFGIMGLTKLFNRNVKKAFEVNRPGGDVDAV